MKICISEFTYNSFEELLENNFKNDEFILIDSEANIISGEGKPDCFGLLRTYVQGFEVRKFF